MSAPADRHPHARLVLVLDGTGSVEDAWRTPHPSECGGHGGTGEPHSFSAATTYGFRFVCLDGARE